MLGVGSGRFARWCRTNRLMRCSLRVNIEGRVSAKYRTSPANIVSPWDPAHSVRHDCPACVFRQVAPRAGSPTARGRVCHNTLLSHLPGEVFAPLTEDLLSMCSKDSRTEVVEHLAKNGFDFEILCRPRLID